MPYFDYYAFSEQDAVWMEEKLAYAVQRLEYDKARMYYSNAYVTDSDLKIIGKLNPRYDISMQYVMFRQPTLGCTQVMTREYLYFCVATFRKFMLGNPLSVPLHDVWTIWLSQLTASAVIADDKSYMYYRQHDNNVTNHKTEGVIAKYRRVSRRLKREKGIECSSSSKTKSTKTRLIVGYFSFSLLFDCQEIHCVFHKNSKILITQNLSTTKTFENNKQIKKLN